MTKFFSTLFATVFTTGAALSQEVSVFDPNTLCTSNYENVAPHLSLNFGEERQFAGFSVLSQSMVEMYANEKTGSWTVIEITPDGTACVIDFGIMFMSHKPNV